MGQIEWAMWANEQGVVSAAILLLGGVLGLAGQYSRWQLGVCSVVVGLLVLLVEWPRGLRLKGSTMERQFQKPFTMLVNKLGLFGKNYFVRFVAYLLLCIPCCVILATLMGGVCLLATSIIYFVAAMKGEEWRPVGLDGAQKSGKKRSRSLHPPKKPPPRLRSQDQELGEGSEVGTDNITMEISDDTEAAAEPARQMPKAPTRPPPRPKTAAIRDTIQET